MDLQSAAEILRLWAHRSGCVQRLWIWGSVLPQSGKCPHADSDFDLAVQLVPSRDHPLVLLHEKRNSWARLLRPLLRPHVPYPLHISLFPYDEHSAASSVVKREIERYGWLVYDRSAASAAS